MPDSSDPAGGASLGTLPFTGGANLGSMPVNGQGFSSGSNITGGAALSTLRDRPPKCNGKCMFDPNYTGAQSDLSPDQQMNPTYPGLARNLSSGMVAGSAGFAGGPLGGLIGVDSGMAAGAIQSIGETPTMVPADGYGVLPSAPVPSETSAFTPSSGGYDQPLETYQPGADYTLGWKR